MTNIRYTILEPLVLHAIDFLGSPNPRKIAILLSALQLPYKVKLWQFGGTDNGVDGPVFTQINETGRVPALEDPNTGVVAWESGAIINYILRRYDRTNRFGPGEQDQEIVDFAKWTDVLNTGLGPVTSQLKYWQKTTNAEAVKRYQDIVYRNYQILDERLGRNGGWVMEQGWSAVDMHFYPWLVPKVQQFAGVSSEGYPYIQDWVRKVGERPEVVEAYKKVLNGVIV
ncbi:MAG: hypothetical protein M1825_004098 [Sarcosagium campestre]|nr:MAG: hypothetical protein M1825_004098 [Sarcosagium campestre]